MDKDDALFYVFDFVYRNGKVVDSREILPSYFDESTLIKHSHLHSQQMFECKDWNEQFLKDLTQAKRKVVIFSPFLSEEGVGNLVDTFRSFIDKRVGVYVVTRPVIERKKKLIDLQKYLEELGVKLIYREKLYEKVIFIDNKVCWLSNFDILSQNGGFEFIFSIRTKEVIARLYQFFGVSAFIDSEGTQDEIPFLWGSLQSEPIFQNKKIQLRAHMD
jgi:hypothetical protein